MTQNQTSAVLLVIGSLLTVGAGVLHTPSLFVLAVPALLGAGWLYQPRRRD